jgi:hypothetical protein
MLDFGLDFFFELEATGGSVVGSAVADWECHEE